jgi:hypothetical protein
VGGVVAPLKGRSKDGRRIIVTLPPYDSVWSLPNAGSDGSKTITVKGSAAVCNPGYEKSYSGKNCYKYEASKLSWADARVFCQTNGNDLASIESDKDDKFIADKNWGNVWIGLTDESEEGTWVNVDGTTPGWFGWKGGEPNNRGTENCVLIIGRNSWNDALCTSKYPFVCGHALREEEVSWSCPPSCPSGQATTTNRSKLYPSNTENLRSAVGGITYVQRCTENQRNNVTTSPSSVSLMAPFTSSNQCAKATKGIIPFVTDLRSCLDPARAQSAPCAYGEGGDCKCCPANARCPGGARTWPARGYWVSSENSTKVNRCNPPQMERCMGMVHGSMISRQCGAGYEGVRCERCAKEYYKSTTTGACTACRNMTARRADEQGQELSVEEIAPLLWLAFAVALCFGGILAIVILFMRRQGGSLMGGLFRAMDFVCYLIILLQTTLYIANDTVKNTMDVVLNEFTDMASSSSSTPAENAAAFIKAFFESVSIIQLDFRNAVQLPCLGGDALEFEAVYAVLTCLIVLVYVAALLVLPRLRCIKEKLLYAVSKQKFKRALLYQEFAYRVGVWLVLTHAVSCRVALSNMQCAEMNEGGEKGGIHGSDNGSSCKNAAWPILFLIHCIGFPLAVLFGAIHVRKRMLGGTCCKDSRATIEKQNEDTRVGGELGLWRYYLDYDYKARFHWFRAVNMAVLLTIVGSETSIRSPAAANATEKGGYDLSRTCIQAIAVLIYLLLLLITRPYVGFPSKRHEVLQHAIRLRCFLNRRVYMTTL